MKKFFLWLLLLGFGLFWAAGSQTVPPAVFSLPENQGFRLTFPEKPGEAEGRAEMNYDPASGDFILEVVLGGKTYREIYEPYTNFTAHVASEVVYSPQTGLFTYFYTVKNVFGSQPVRAFALFSRAEIFRTQQPEKWQRFAAPTLVSPYGEWSARDGAKLIEPGEIKCFSLQSPAPPGIVEARLFGRRRVAEGESEIVPYPPELKAKMLEFLNSPGFAYRRVYLPGPLPLPDDKPQTLAERFTLLLDRAGELKWLAPEDPGRLKDSFKSYQAALSAGEDPQEASRRLREKLEKMRNHGAIGNNAYQLLKGNLLFGEGEKKYSLRLDYPPQIKSCRQRLEFLGRQIEAFYAANYRFPRHLGLLGYPAVCPDKGTTYFYQWNTLPWTYTVSCKSCPGEAGSELEYTGRLSPTPEIDKERLNHSSKYR